MATLRQIEANRLNAQKSTGPRSVAGKAVSSRNALKSGIDAKSQIIPGEKAEDLQSLTDQYLDRYQPADAEERFWVDVLICTEWMHRRYQRVEADLWKYQFEIAYRLDQGHPLGQTFDKGSKTFRILQSRISAVLRDHKQAIRELQLLQASRPSPDLPHPDTTPVSQPIETTTQTSQIGFVPTTLPDIAPGTCDRVGLRLTSQVPRSAPENLRLDPRLCDYS